MRVVDLSKRRIGDGAEISARIIDLPGKLPDFTLWFRFPETDITDLSDRADPFVPALLPAAMHVPCALLIEGSVSSQLFDGSIHYMKLWSRWNSIFHEIEIRPGAVLEDEHDSPARVASFFSGGVDSFYTVLKHLGRPDSGLTDLLFLDMPGLGFDPETDEAVYMAALSSLRAVSGELGLELVTGLSNLRVLCDRFVDYASHSLGACLAAAGLCLGPRYRRIYIPSSYAYHEAVPYGSHPLTDPLWSNGLVEFVHDGGEANRAQKVLRLVSRSRLALRNLRTCTSNEAIRSVLAEGYQNCGRCEKDLRTRVALAAAGIRDRDTCFPPVPLLEALRHSKVETDDSAMFVEENLNALRQTGRELEIQTILEEKLTRYRSRAWPKVRRYLASVDHCLLGDLGRKLKRAWRRRPG